MLNLFFFFNILAIGLFKNSWNIRVWNCISFLILIFFLYILSFNSYFISSSNELGLYNDFGICSFSIFFISRSGHSHFFSTTSEGSKLESEEGQVLNFNIQWFTLDEKGFIQDSEPPVRWKPAIYIYQYILDEDKIYIGSTSDLFNRINQHRVRANSGDVTCPKFYNAIRKYGWNNFRFSILEYINLELYPGGGHDESESNTKIKKEIILKREQYYLDLFLPSLNVNKIAGSSLGIKYSEESKEKMSEAQKGEKNHMFGKTHSDITKEKMSLVKKGEKNNMFGKTHSEEIKLRLSQANGTTIYLYSLDKILIQIFPSAKKAAKHLKSTNATIIKYTGSGKIFRNQYILSLKELLS